VTHRTPRAKVVVRPSVLVIERPHGSREEAAPAPVAPDADRALSTLESFGFQVEVASGDTEELELTSRDWLLTRNGEDCRWARRTGARTILIGAAGEAPQDRLERCDMVANSLFAAAMEIVSRVVGADEPTGPQGGQSDHRGAGPRLI
jgi:hypothetical protein